MPSLGRRKVVFGDLREVAARLPRPGVAGAAGGGAGSEGSRFSSRRAVPSNEKAGRQKDMPSAFSFFLRDIRQVGHPHAVPHSKAQLMRFFSMEVKFSAKYT